MNAKLPSLYSEAFSLHLANTCGNFSQAKVAAVEWLGGKTNLKEIQKAFHLEQINYRYGKAFFVYQDGKTQQF